MPNRDAWANVSFRCHPSVFTDGHRSRNESEAWLSKIMAGSAQKSPLTDHRILAKNNLVGVYQSEPYLLKEIGATALGALSFFALGDQPIPKQTNAESRSRYRRGSS